MVLLRAYRQQEEIARYTVAVMSLLRIYNVYYRSGVVGILWGMALACIRGDLDRRYTTLPSIHCLVTSVQQNFVRAIRFGHALSKMLPDYLRGINSRCRAMSSTCNSLRHTVFAHCDGRPDVLHRGMDCMTRIIDGAVCGGLSAYIAWQCYCLNVVAISVYICVIVGVHCRQRGLCACVTQLAVLCMGGGLDTRLVACACLAGVIHPLFPPPIDIEAIPEESRLLDGSVTSKSEGLQYYMQEFMMEYLEALGKWFELEPSGVAPDTCAYCHLEGKACRDFQASYRCHNCDKLDCWNVWYGSSICWYRGTCGFGGLKRFTSEDARLGSTGEHMFADEVHLLGGRRVQIRDTVYIATSASGLGCNCLIYTLDRCLEMSLSGYKRLSDDDVLVVRNRIGAFFAGHPDGDMFEDANGYLDFQCCASKVVQCLLIFQGRQEDLLGEAWSLICVKMQSGQRGRGDFDWINRPDTEEAKILHLAQVNENHFVPLELVTSKMPPLAGNTRTYIRCFHSNLFHLIQDRQSYDSNSTLDKPPN